MPRPKKEPAKPAPQKPTHVPTGLPSMGGAAKGAHERLAKRFEKEARQAAAQRIKALESFQKRWEQSVSSVLAQASGITPAQLEADVRKYVELQDDGERVRLRGELQARYGKAIEAIQKRLGAPLPPLGSPALNSSVRPGPCPIDDQDVLRILVCGGFGLCACPTQRVANPSIFTAPAVTGGFQSTADPATGNLSVRDRSAVLAAPHTFARLNGSFTVPADASTVNIFLPVTIGHATVTLAGVGYAHGWITLRLRVVDQIDATRDVVNCSQELMNEWTWWGGYDTILRRPASGPVGLMGCFTRTPTGAPQSFLFSVELSVNGTVLGGAGVQVDASATVDSMLLIACR